MTEANLDPGADPNPAPPPGADPGGNLDLNPADGDKGGEGDKAPPKGGSIADGNTDGPVVTSDFPDDWQVKMAGDDEKMAKALARFSSPKDVAKSWAEATARVSQGFKAPEKPGPDATAEQIAEYRKEQGIPDTVEDYVQNLGLPDGVTVGDDDKAVVTAFAEDLHKAGLPPEALGVVFNKYQQIVEQAADNEAEQDDAHRIDSLAELKQEFGHRLDHNLQAARTAFADVDDEAFDQMMAARLPNGRQLGNEPAILRAVMALAMKADPGAAVVPNSDNAEKSIKEEIASYEKMMREDRQGWHADKAAQERYRELLDAEARLSAA